MESLEQKLNRVHGDVKNLIQLYEYAESLYPYDKIREPATVIRLI